MELEGRAAKDRLGTQHDDEVNLEAEMAIVALHLTLDELGWPAFEYVNVRRAGSTTPSMQVTYVAPAASDKTGFGHRI